MLTNINIYTAVVILNHISYYLKLPDDFGGGRGGYVGGTVGVGMVI
jgi:hypothetical protein